MNIEALPVRRLADADRIRAIMDPELKESLELNRGAVDPPAFRRAVERVCLAP